MALANESTCFPRFQTMLEFTTPKFKAALWLLIVYLLGIAIGAVAGQLTFSHVHASTSVRLTPRTESVELGFHF